MTTHTGATQTSTTLAHIANNMHACAFTYLIDGTQRSRFLVNHLVLDGGGKHRAILRARLRRKNGRRRPTTAGKLHETPTADMMADVCTNAVRTSRARSSCTRSISMQSISLTLSIADAFGHSAATATSTAAASYRRELAQTYTNTHNGAFTFARSGMNA